jgi:hypothetical protein
VCNTGTINEPSRRTPPSRGCAYLTLAHLNIVHRARAWIILTSHAEMKHPSATADSQTTLSRTSILPRVAFESSGA